MLLALVVAVTFAQDADVARRLDEILPRLGSERIEDREAASDELSTLPTAFPRAVLRRELRRRLATCDGETRDRLQLELDCLGWMPTSVDVAVFRAVDSIVKRLGDEDPQVREAASAEWRKLTDEHGRPLVLLLERRLGAAAPSAQPYVRAEVKLLYDPEVVERGRYGPVEHGEEGPSAESRLRAQRREWEEFLGLLMLAGFVLWCVCAIVQRRGAGRSMRIWPLLPGAWRLHFGPRYARPARIGRCKLPC